MIRIHHEGHEMRTRRSRSQAQLITEEERTEAMRDIVDQHDTHYQLGGWDRWVPGNDTELYLAAQRGDLKGVTEALTRGDDPDEPNMHGWTALMIACAEQHVEVALALMRSGADPNRYNSLGRTALMFAAGYGNVPLVAALLEHGADPLLNRSADHGALAGAAGNGHADVVDMLLRAGADPKQVDRDGHTPIRYAQLAGHGAIAAKPHQNLRWLDCLVGSSTR